MKQPLLIALLLAALTAASALYAYKAGGVAYTKRVETVLLEEPKPLAAPAGKLALGRTVTIEEVAGAWLRVSDGPVSGWVFAGNLSDTKPAEHKGLDDVPLLASETTSTAAARPLAPVAVQYAAEKNLASAQADLEWLLTECRAVTPDQVDAYLQEKKKGEYQ